MLLSLVNFHTIFHTIQLFSHVTTLIPLVESSLRWNSIPKIFIKTWKGVSPLVWDSFIMCWTGGGTKLYNCPTPVNDRLHLEPPLNDSYLFTSMPYIHGVCTTPRSPNPTHAFHEHGTKNQITKKKLFCVWWLSTCRLFKWLRP